MESGRTTTTGGGREMMQHTFLCVDIKVLTKNTSLEFNKPYEGIFIMLDEGDIVFVETKKGGKQ